ncbi:hypothetical protein JCM3765_002698 [Sporobolomyces pararoseus]
MTSKDVRDIMQLGPAPTPSSGSSGLIVPPSNSSSSKRSGPPLQGGAAHKRPDGITRELYALIGDNSPSLQLAGLFLPGGGGLEVNKKPKFKERKLKNSSTLNKNNSGEKKSKVKWQLIGFKNPSRKQSNARSKLILKHWVKDVPKNYIDGTEDKKFEKFNTTSQPFSYTSQEYDQWLKVEGWSKEETDHLFSLAVEYDLRFIVIADRWELQRERSVDELKDRYYSICRILAEKRPDPPIISSSSTSTATTTTEETKALLDKQRTETIQSFSFDLSKELERKQYLKSLLERTREQIQEEDWLYVESRRIEQNYHKIVQERKKLLKILGGRDGIGSENLFNGVLQVSANGSIATTNNNNNLKSTGGSSTGLVGAVGGAGSSSSNNKKKMHGWEFEGNGNGLPEGWAGEGSKRKATAAQDAANCIERHPAPSVSAPKSNMWPSVALRSSRIQPVKSNVAQKVSIALSELGLSTQLIMPTKTNIEKLDQVQSMLSQMVEVKKAVDRIQQEIRTVRKKKDLLLGIGGTNSQRSTPLPHEGGGGEGGPQIKLEDNSEDRQRNKRSASVASSTVSTKRARRE